MVFKKIDDDTVIADEPLDAFVLQGIEQNLTAARVNAPRRHSFAWPVDDRPVIACERRIAHLLGRWPVTPGVRQVEVRLRYEVQSTDVHVNVGLVTSGGIFVEDLIQKATGTYDDVFTVDVAAFAGDVADLVLVVRSEPINPVVLSVSNFATICGYYMVYLPAGHLFPFTPGDRWSIEWGYEAPTGAGASGSTLGVDPFPEARTIIDYDGSTLPHHKVRVYPGFTAHERGLAGFQSGNYTLTVSELGRLELKGISVESVQNEWPSQRLALLPGQSPSAQACGSLYSNGRRFMVEQTRIFQFGPKYTFWQRAPNGGQAHQNYRLMWGEMVSYTRHIWKTIGSVLVGRYDMTELDGVDRERVELNIAGFIQLVAREVHPFKVTLRVRLLTRQGAAPDVWDPVAAVTSDELEISSISRALGENYHDPQGLLMGYTKNFPSQSHFLRGAQDYASLSGPSSAGITPFRMSISETTSQVARMLLEVQVKGSFATLEGTPIDMRGFGAGVQTAIVCPSFTVWVNETTAGLEV